MAQNEETMAELPCWECEIDGRDIFSLRFVGDDIIIPKPTRVDSDAYEHEVHILEYYQIWVEISQNWMGKRGVLG